MTPNTDRCTEIGIETDSRIVSNNGELIPMSPSRNAKRNAHRICRCILPVARIPRLCPREGGFNDQSVPTPIAPYMT